jgi:hypothetical protein
VVVRDGNTLNHPLAQRFGSHAQLRTEALGCGLDRRVVLQTIKNHSCRAVTLLARVLLRHEVHPSQKRKRHQTRDGHFVSVDVRALTQALIDTLPQVKVAVFERAEWDTEPI